MAEFNFDNLAKNLPDCYKKDKDSNNYKILETERSATYELRTLLHNIESILDIDNATGATLDMYGKRYGQPRGQANDAQYITMIKSKIVRGLCNGSYKNIVDAICFTFGCNADDVCLSEMDIPMKVKLEKVPLDVIASSGFTAEQAQQIVQNLLPVTVILESVTFDGTFEFAETENEYDENAGFCDVEGGNIGGILGWASSEEGTLLPI